MQNVMERRLGCLGLAAAAQFKFCAALPWLKPAQPWFNPLPWSGTYTNAFEVCTISFERPVNYLCDAWHVFPPKYEAWTHFNRP